jgi:hypothetical protein
MATHPAAAAPVVAPGARRGPELVERSPAHHDSGASWRGRGRHASRRRCARQLRLRGARPCDHTATPSRARGVAVGAAAGHVSRLPVRQYLPAANPRCRIGWQRCGELRNAREAKMSYVPQESDDGRSALPSDAPFPHSRLRAVTASSGSASPGSHRFPRRDRTWAFRSRIAEAGRL